MLTVTQGKRLLGDFRVPRIDWGNNNEGGFAADAIRTETTSNRPTGTREVIYVPYPTVKTRTLVPFKKGGPKSSDSGFTQKTGPLFEPSTTPSESMRNVATDIKDEYEEEDDDREGVVDEVSRDEGNIAQRGEFGMRDVTDGEGSETLLE